MHYLITEHHYQIKGGRTWSVDVGTTTNIRRAISQLSGKRREGDMPITLSHWTIGTKRVAAQSATRLFDRQMEAHAEEFIHPQTEQET